MKAFIGSVLYLIGHIISCTFMRLEKIGGFAYPIYNWCMIKSLDLNPKLWHKGPNEKQEKEERKPGN